MIDVATSAGVKSRFGLSGRVASQKKPDSFACTISVREEVYLARQQIAGVDAYLRTRVSMRI